MLHQQGNIVFVQVLTQSFPSNTSHHSHTPHALHTSHTPLTSVLRDINERGRDLDQILSQYTHYVKPAFEEFTLPVGPSLSRTGIYLSPSLSQASIPLTCIHPSHMHPSLSQASISLIIMHPSLIASFPRWVEAWERGSLSHINQL